MLITTKSNNNDSQCLRTEKIDRQLDVITTISVKSFLNLHRDDSAFYYRSISRHSAIFLPFSSSTLQCQMARRHVTSFSVFNFNCHMERRDVPFLFVLTAERTIIKNFAFSSVSLAVTLLPNYTIRK